MRFLRGTGYQPVFSSKKKSSRAGSPCHVVLIALCLCGCASPKPPAIQPTSMPTTKFEDVLKRFNLDDRLTLCDVWQKPDGTIAGFVEMPQYRDVLRREGFDVSKVKLMPEEGATTDRFGIVTVDHAILRKFPKDQPGDRDNATDALRGETCWILDQKPDGWTLVHSSDGYLGWATPGSIGWRMDVESFQVVVKHERLLKTGAAPRGFTSPGQLITGLDVRPTAGLDRELEEQRIAQKEQLPRQITDEAKTFLGTRYIWGGKTREGIDCSGLVQTSFARNNVLLPRDAYQQANVGQLVATRWFTGALLPADLLFFISAKHGNVSHVAIYLGAGKYIEAAGPDVHIRSMTPGDADYDAERMATFGWARRVIE